MPLYTKESIDTLRDRIDLGEVVGAYVQLKKRGSAYKGLCPFHEEKTASFMIQQGDRHYHCFGCGAHGDAITFLMQFQKLSFVEALEALADRYGVTLEKSERVHDEGPSKREIRDVLEGAAKLYHIMLLHAEEGRPALEYLYERGVDLALIRRFQLGYAPRDRTVVRHYVQGRGGSDAALRAAGLLSSGDGRAFFHDRITIPIRDGMHHVVGFSARKFREETFGGKYVNTPETALFKKSQVLFGLDASRPRIMKDRKALVVEGQLDCLRLIMHGFDWTVGGQGTALGIGHVKALTQLGVQSVYLALDGDAAGREATVKIGDLLHRHGLQVWVVGMGPHEDPDTVLRTHGATHFAQRVDAAIDYLTFVVRKESEAIRPEQPSSKQQVVQQLVQRIQGWEQPVLIHESLERLSQLMQVPRETLQVHAPIPTPVPRVGRVHVEGVNGDQILEADLLRLLVSPHPEQAELIRVAVNNVSPEQLRDPCCRRLYEAVVARYREGKSVDLMGCAVGLERAEEGDFVMEMMRRKVNLVKAVDALGVTLQRILERNWLQEREELRSALQAAPDDEALELVKRFGALSQTPPQVRR